MERPFIEKLDLRIRKKNFKDSGTMNRKEGFRRPRSVTTEENTDLTEEAICSEEKAPHTHLAPRKSPNKLGSVVRQLEE